MTRRGAPARSRRGGVYVLVLVTVAVVAAMLVASLDVVRARFAEGSTLADSSQAWQHAESVLEGAIHVMESSPDWRWSLGDGAWVQDQAYGDSVVTLEATGADGATLDDDAWQPVRLTAIARCGRARAIMRLDLGMQGSGFPGAGSTLYANNLLGYWPLADGSRADRVQSNTAQEKSSSGRFRGGAVPGLGASAAAWFGDGGELEIDHLTSYAAIRSVSVWIRPEDVTTTRAIALRDESGYDAGSWYLSVGFGALRGAFESNTGITVSSAAISAGSWHHVVLVAESTQVMLYIDGVEVDRTPAATASYWNGASSAPDILLGTVSGSAGSGALSGAASFEGSMCEFAIMGDALTAAEVLALYNSYPAPAEYKILADSWDRDVR
ncbi:MAG TPA: LamG domain-containing protein [Phycisphaerales bacterium]|nr:LamG domain-containing protein [Phycisphaerales bacterium]